MTFTIYRNVESVLGVLNSYKLDNTQAVATLLEVYNKALKKFKDNEINSKATKKHPLIILEGLDGCGKSTVSKVLAAKINAAQWCTPPKSTKSIRSHFDDHPVLEMAYYALGNYIAALECSVLLKEQPVIMDRYWHSTAAYGIAQAVHDTPSEVEIPPQGDNFYQWPSDLLKPDAVVFLNVNEDIRLERLSRRLTVTTQETLLKESEQFRQNIILAYKNMVDPDIIFVDSNSTVKNVVSTLNDKLTYLFK